MSSLYLVMFVFGILPLIKVTRSVVWKGFKVVVNNKTLVPISIQDKTYLYNYEFRPNLHNISCIFEGEGDGIVAWTTMNSKDYELWSSETYYLYKYYDIHYVYKNFKLTKDYDGMTFNCNFMDKDKSEDIVKAVISLKYAPVIGFKVVVNNKTLVPISIQTQNKTYLYNYEFRPNPLNISCLYKGDDPVVGWSTLDSKGGERWSSKIFHLTKNSEILIYNIELAKDGWMKFTCNFKDKDKREHIVKAVISFKYTPVSEPSVTPSPTVPHNETDTEVSMASQGIQEPSVTPSPTVPHNETDTEVSMASQGIQAKIWFYPAVVGAGVVIIIIIVCIIRVLTKKTRDTEQLVPAEYDNPNETPPPNFPENTTLEETYCRPLDNSNQDNPYSTPFVPKSPEQLYTVPLPKSARKPRNINDMSLTHYAQVTKSLKNKIANDDLGCKSVEVTKIPKNKIVNEDVGYESVNHHAKVKPSQDVEPSYASVGVEHNYDYATVGNKSNYANVFGDGKYVNSNNKVDYVEPSYCEVNAK